MKVSDAVAQRKSIREFLDTPISSELVKSLLIKASRAASGGNLQPWKIYVLNGKSMDDFLIFQQAWDEARTACLRHLSSQIKRTISNFTI
jgi:hypothetical protein